MTNPTSQSQQPQAIGTSCQNLHLNGQDGVVHAIFPTLVYQGKLKISEKDRLATIHHLLSEAPADDDDKLRVTADTARQTLHLEEEFSSFARALRSCLNEFFHGYLKYPRALTRFHIGRCWGVIQKGDAEGDVHFHGGATFSGVAYLQMSPGAGGIEFTRPNMANADLFYRATSGFGPHLIYRIDPEETDVIIFNSELRHRAMRSRLAQDAARVAIAFDIYAMTHISNFAGGIPLKEYLKPIEDL